MTSYNLQPINTVLSVDSILNIKELIDAKVLMNENYGNKYSHIPPHLAYTIMPCHEDRLQEGIALIENYISNQKAFQVNISELIYEEYNKFYYVEITGKEIKEHHEKITTMLNQLRDNYVREKDLLRINNGDFNAKESNYLINFGNARVFDNFKTHVTIGNFTVDNVNVGKLTKELKSILNPILNRDIIIDNIHGVFHTDSAKNQSEMRQLWDKVFTLSV